MPGEGEGPEVGRGDQAEAGAGPADVRGHMDAAARALATHALGSDALGSVTRALEHAFAYNPSDPHGEVAALLGRLCFQQGRYADGVRHLEAAVRARPDDAAVRHVLDRARRNCETSIERPLVPVVYTDAVAMVTPPALYLRAPEIIAPLPFDPHSPWALGSWLGRVQDAGGAVAGVVVGAVSRLIRLLGTNDEKRSAWERRKGIFGLVTLASYREWLNDHVMQDPYLPGELTAHQPPGQKRPEWTKTMPTANGSWRTDDPMEGAAFARFAQQGAQPFERFQSRVDDPRLPNPREVARLFLHRRPGQDQVLAPFLNKLYIAWIQFQSHDWFNHGENTATTGTYKIPLAADDPIRLQHGIEFLEIKKTQPDPHPSHGPAHVPERGHTLVGRLAVVRQRPGAEDRVRTGADGRLLEDGKLYLPQNLLPINPVTGIEDTGFTRNWWLGLSMFHTLFARHHNPICDGLSGLPGASVDERPAVQDGAARQRGRDGQDPHGRMDAGRPAQRQGGAGALHELVGPDRDARKPFKQRRIQQRSRSTTRVLAGSSGQAGQPWRPAPVFRGVRRRIPAARGPDRKDRHPSCG